jgi:trans-aconitate methyltransferase
MTQKSILIVGEDPAFIDFGAPDAPKGMTAAKIMTGLNDSVARLKAAGHDADLLLTRDAESVEAQVSSALQRKNYDVIVIGAGLRVLPAMAEQFERLMNVLHSKAVQSKFAFNSRPDDSDAAARRWL